jgi:single-strand DNA-binding protein
MTTTPVPTGTNLALLVGTLNRSPELRPLPAGDSVLTLDLTIRPEGEPAESVPVAWYEAPDEALGWPVGEEVLVTGRTRRRFFRAGGVTQSRTEVVADVVVPARQAKRAARLAQAAWSEVEVGLADGAG